MDRAFAERRMPPARAAQLRSAGFDTCVLDADGPEPLYRVGGPEVWIERIDDLIADVTLQQSDDFKADLAEFVLERT